MNNTVCSNDNLSYDVNLLEQLAEVSEEARQVLEQVRSMFYKQVANVALKNGVKLHPAPQFPRHMSREEELLQNGKLKWKVTQVWDDRRKNDKVLGQGSAETVPHAMLFYHKCVLKLGNLAYNTREKCYVGTDYRVTVSVTA